MPSNTPPLPSPELDGDFDPSIHLTPTRDATQQSTVPLMKSSVIMFPSNMEDDDDLDMRDSSSPNGAHGRVSYIREQSSPPFISAGPQDGFSPPALSALFRRTTMEDDTTNDLFLPPGRSPSHTSGGSAGMPGNAPVGLVASTRPPDAGPFVSSSFRGSETSADSSFLSNSSKDTAGTPTPNKRRRSRHVRSTFVLDGSFSFGGSSTSEETTSVASQTPPSDHQHRASFPGSQSKVAALQRPYPRTQNRSVSTSGIPDLDKLMDEL